MSGRRLPLNLFLSSCSRCGSAMLNQVNSHARDKSFMAFWNPQSCQNGAAAPTASTKSAYTNATLTWRTFAEGSASASAATQEAKAAVIAMHSRDMNAICAETSRQSVVRLLAFKRSSEASSQTSCLLALLDSSFVFFKNPKSRKSRILDMIF